jgi:hypothetical protein
MENDMPNTDSRHWQETSMGNEPPDYDPQLTDEERIEELETKCAKLAAQLDRQAKVVEAALAVTRSLRGTTDWSAEESALEYAARMYQQHVAQLAKEG